MSRPLVCPGRFCFFVLEKNVFFFFSSFFFGGGFKQQSTPNNGHVLLLKVPLCDRSLPNIGLCTAVQVRGESTRADFQAGSQAWQPALVAP